MSIESLLGVLIIGGLAGWIAGLLVKGKGQGLVMNIIVG
ncbi:MAG: GlsB/YeaQ/YmgE family stress response membrane protein, partial [Gammaproteobacteria bacterium]|nr:GlsB/YeaQ/YmgE family stress response membrane protein [Gammaproteobacteria bacterium]